MAWVSQEQLGYLCSLAGPSDWNAQPWGNGKGMKGMGWDQPKGKSKGKGVKGEKGKKGTKGKGKTDGKGAKGDGGADCGCCGLDNHVKSDCRHKHKTCNHCGIAGHLGHMCRKKLAA